MGAEFRAFVDKTCPSFDTRELAREIDARNRREQKEKQSQAQTNPSTGSSGTEQKVAGPKRKTFSLRRYTYHALGDYGSMIRQFGTLDSFSTEPVRSILLPPWSNLMQIIQGELEHRTSKARYRRTDRKKFVRALTQIERREARLRRIRARHPRDDEEAERAPNTLHQHHHVGNSQNKHEHIGTFLRRHFGDPAIKVR